MATFNDIVTVINSLVSQAKGTTALTEVDVTNIASLGEKLIDSTDDASKDVIFKELIDRIGKTIIDNKQYKGKFDYIFKSAFEFGCILQKIHVDTFNAVTSAVYDIEDGEVDEDLYKIFLPSVHQTLFENATPWEFRVTITRKQIKSAFTSAETLTAFVNGIYIAMQTSIEKYIETEARAVIVRLITAKLTAEADENVDGIHAINVLQKYYDETGEELTTTSWLYDADFLRWLTSEFVDGKRMLAELTTIYNTAGYDRFTDESGLVFNIISKVGDNIMRFMEADIYNNELVGTPAYKPITYWQGIGSGVVDRMTIKTKVKNPDYDEDEEESEEYISTDAKVIGIMYDVEALGVSIKDRDTVSVPNPHKHTENLFEQGTLCSYIDTTENALVFYVDTVDTGDDDTE